MELQAHRRILLRPAVAAAISAESPRLAAAIGNAATHAVSGVASDAAMAGTPGRSTSGILARIKQAGLRVNAAESALSALRGSDGSLPEVTDVQSDMHDLQERLKRTEQA